MIRASALIAFGLFCATGASAQTTATTTAPPAQPTCDAPEHHALDFWVGEWDAYVTGTDHLAGRSSITSIDHGCTISEHWESQRASYSGHSLTLYDALSHHWEQFYTDSTGDIIHFTGRPIEHGLELTAASDVDPQDTHPHFTRMTLTRNDDGSVRQVGTASADGRTWTPRYDFTYKPHREGGG